jgi:hypothetical protein
MVNSTALESILKFIQKQNIKKMKPWSQRSSSNSKETADWYIRKLRKQILELLAIVSVNCNVKRRPKQRSIGPFDTKI